MIVKGRQTGNFRSFTLNVDPGSKFIESFAGGISWYKIEGKDFISKKSFKLKNQIASFSGQSITFRKSIKDI